MLNQDRPRPHRIPLLENRPVWIKRLLPLLATAVLAAAVGLPAPSRGQVPAVAGVWQLAGSVQQAQQAVEQAVQPAIATLTPDMQRLARARIAESTWVPQVVRIAANPTQISVTIEGSENRTFTSTPGQPQNVYSRSGVRAALTQLVRPDGGIEQQLRALDGAQYNIYQAQPDGRSMSLDVTIQSQRLAQDVRFRVMYQRGG